jgi:hypothetical protein
MKLAWPEIQKRLDSECGNIVVISSEFGSSAGGEVACAYGFSGG